MKRWIIALALLTGPTLQAQAQALPGSTLVCQASPATPVPCSAEQVRALVNQWFSLQDSQTRTENLLALLDPQGWQLNFPEGELHAPADFNIWWHAFLHRCPRSTHEISNLQVEATDKGYEARMDVDWNGEAGATISSFQRWEVRDNGGVPVIHSMHVVFK